MNKHIYTLFAFLGLGLLVFYVLFLNPSTNFVEKNDTRFEQTLFINEVSIPVDVANTDPERTQGLSGKSALDEKAGLLFVFEQPDTYGFWMKDMQFPIDIIWIDETWVVVDITENISPDTFPRVFKPQTPIKYVLEVNAGFATKNNISVGDVVVSNKDSN